MTPAQKKSVRIAVVDSDQVVQHILPLENAGTPQKRKNGSGTSGDLTYTASFSISGTKESQVVITDESENEEVNGYMDIQSSGACDGSRGVLSGGEIFQFRTPKKSNQMVLKAKSSCSPSTPKNKLMSRNSESPGSRKRFGQTSNRGSTTPDSKKAACSVHPLTPKQSLQQRTHKRMESSTPYRLRKRNMAIQQADSSSDDSMDDLSEGSDGEDEAEDDVAKQRLSNGAVNTDDMNMAATAEAYFDLHAMTPMTSDRTLSALDGPRLDIDTIREVLQKTDTGHHKQLRSLTNSHEKLFKKWMFYLCCDYNILLHGLGSKRSLLNKFREQHLMKFSHLVINGYFPSLTIKHILNAITDEMLNSSKGFSDIFSQVEYIKDAYRNSNEDFFLIIHNIDGVLLRLDKTQAILSHLSQIKGFHIVATVDHINAVFMWDQNKYFRFHWLWFETPTFLPYEAENSYENSLLVQQSGALALSSMVHVMRSLTPNARQVFLMLAEYQLENGGSPNYPGMSFQGLYQKCREAFLVNSDLTLQAQLVEFKDHRLIRSKKNYEGIEHLIIPVDHVTLKEFLSEQENARS